jgi:hypothetical protein
VAEGARGGLGLGLVIGAAVGSAATWVAMARPWRSGAPPPPVTADAAPEPEQPDRRGRKKRPRKTAPGGQDAPPVLSAADRAMTWRGAAITLPERSVDMADGQDGRALTSSEIDEVMRRSSDPILACIQGGMAGAELTGKLELELLVGERGDVQKVRVGAPRWLVAHGATDCAAAAARRLRFPPTGAPTVVNAPFHIE